MEPTPIDAMNAAAWILAGYFLVFLPFLVLRVWMGPMGFRWRLFITIFLVFWPLVGPAAWLLFGDGIERFVVKTAPTRRHP